ncbi:MAG TPA: SHOCT domain-containing protein [Thermoleophilia bacterium]|nr:SHOCT domain-containing protein [Thermoleophilia bacterium]
MPVAIEFWDYFWGFITVMLGLSLLVLWVYLFIDIMTRKGIGPFARVLWVIAIFVLPWIGGLIYLLVRPFEGESSTWLPAKYHEGGAEGGWSQQMADLVALHESGKLTDAEFTAAKAKLLA